MSSKSTTFSGRRQKKFTFFVTFYFFAFIEIFELRIDSWALAITFMFMFLGGLIDIFEWYDTKSATFSIIASRFS